MWMCFPLFCRFEQLWKVNFFLWEHMRNVLGCPAHQSVSLQPEELLLISISSIWWPPYLVAMSIQLSAQVPIQRTSGISTADAHERGRRWYLGPVNTKGIRPPWLLNDHNTPILVETVKKSMDYSPKAFWRAQAFSVNPKLLPQILSSQPWRDVLKIFPKIMASIVHTCRVGFHVDFSSTENVVQNYPHVNLKRGLWHSQSLRIEEFSRTTA
jgi:hypothetical protein